MSDAENPYNLVVIGGGSAGLVTAYIAAAVKAKVALIEKHRMGGDCLNTGCVPSKTLIKTAKVVHQIRQHRKYGIKSAHFELDLAEVMGRVQGAVKKIEPHDSMERYESLGVECIHGNAEVLDKHSVRVNGRILKTKAIVLALGASPFVPPIRGLSEVAALTSENLWDLKELPKRLLVLGGGAIGCEMAQAFQRLGSQVTLVESAPRLLLKEDEDVSALVQSRFIDEGIILKLNCKAVEVKQQAQEKIMMIEQDGKTEDLAFDAIFVAAGRRANTRDVDWEKLGIALNQDGTIQVDAYLRANASNIYACGDVAGPYQFTHAASHQAWYCAVNALFSPVKSFKVDYRVMPWVTFTDPEIAQVGHNEQSARKLGLDFEVTRYDIGGLDRAIAEAEAFGQVKVLTKRGSDAILGANIVCSQAGDMITEFVSAMKHGYGLNKILSTIHPYPIYSEANKFAAGNWKKAHAPEKILAFLEKLHDWRRS